MSVLYNVWVMVIFSSLCFVGMWVAGCKYPERRYPGWWEDSYFPYLRCKTEQEARDDERRELWRMVFGIPLVLYWGGWAFVNLLP